MLVGEFEVTLLTFEGGLNFESCSREELASLLGASS